MKNITNSRTSDVALPRMQLKEQSIGENETLKYRNKFITN